MLTADRIRTSKVSSLVGATDGSTTDHNQPQAKQPRQCSLGTIKLNKESLTLVDGQGTPTKVCLPIKAIAYVRRTIEPKVSVLVKIIDDQGQTHVELFTKAECKDVKRLIERLVNCGWDYYCDTKTLIAVLKDMLIWSLPEKNLLGVDKPGWHDNGGSGKKVFIYGDQILAPKGEKPAVYFYGTAPFKQKGSLEEWKQFVAKLFKGNSRQILLLSAAFAGPLLGLVKQPNIGILLHGASRSGKTATLAAVCSVYGDEEIMGSWKSTTNALLQSAVARNDLVFPLDELSQAKASDAGMAAYDLMNGHSKHRLNSNSTAQPAPKFKLVTISTGEQSFTAYLAKYGLTTSAGQLARMISIPFSSKGIFENTHGYKDHAALAVAMATNAQKYFGTAGPAFIQHLVNHQDHIEQSAAAEIKKIQDTLMISCADQPETGLLLDVARRLATIAYAGELAIQIGILPFDAGVAIRAARTCFKEWNCQYEAEEAVRNPVFAAVKGYVTDHLASFIPLVDHRSAKGLPCGFTHTVDGVTAFLLSQEAFQQQICLQHGKSAVIAELKSRNLLMLGARGTPTRQVALPGSKSGKQSFYVINSLILSTV